MKSIEKRIVILLTIFTLLIATILPVAAQDTGSSTPPTDGTTLTLSVNLGITGFTVMFSIPVRCGNNC